MPTAGSHSATSARYRGNRRLPEALRTSTTSSTPAHRSSAATSSRAAVPCPTVSRRGPGGCLATPPGGVLRHRWPVHCGPVSDQSASQAASRCLSSARQARAFPGGHVGALQQDAGQPARAGGPHHHDRACPRAPWHVGLARMRRSAGCRPPGPRQGVQRCLEHRMSRLRRVLEQDTGGTRCQRARARSARRLPAAAHPAAARAASGVPARNMTISAAMTVAWTRSAVRRGGLRSGHQPRISAPAHPA